MKKERKRYYTNHKKSLVITNTA